MRSLKAVLDFGEDSIDPLVSSLTDKRKRFASGVI
jgi:hypothetical protein